MSAFYLEPRSPAPVTTEKTKLPNLSQNMPPSAAKLVPQILDKYVAYSKLQAKLLEKFGSNFDTDENIQVWIAYQMISARADMNTTQLTYD